MKITYTDNTDTVKLLVHNAGGKFNPNSKNRFYENFYYIPSFNRTPTSLDLLDDKKDIGGGNKIKDLKNITDRSIGSEVVYTLIMLTMIQELLLKE